MRSLQTSSSSLQTQRENLEALTARAELSEIATAPQFDGTPTGFCGKARGRYLSGVITTRAAGVRDGP